MGYIFNLLCALECVWELFINLVVSLNIIYKKIMEIQNFHYPVITFSTILLQTNFDSNKISRHYQQLIIIIV